MSGILTFFKDVFGRDSSERITAEELKAMLEKKEKVTVIDVRTPGEFGEGHIPGSLSIPLNTLEKAKVAAKGKVVVCCASGVRSRSGRSVLAAKGFKDVVDLKGGITAWAKCGGRIIKG